MFNHFVAVTDQLFFVDKILIVKLNPRFGFFNIFIPLAL
jgi:hypothetical protein